MSDEAKEPRPGDVFAFKTDDYRFWLGPLVVHVKEITARVNYHGEPWWHVVAEVADGTREVHGNWREQELYIRESAIPQTLRGPRT